MKDVSSLQTMSSKKGIRLPGSGKDPKNGKKRKIIIVALLVAIVILGGYILITREEGSQTVPEINGA